MKTFISLIMAGGLFVSNNITASEGLHWEVVTNKQVYKTNTKADFKEYKLIAPNLERLVIQNTQWPLEIAIPSPSGELKTFLLKESSLIPKSLRVKYPNIIALEGVDKNNPNVFGKFDVSPNGLHGVYYEGGSFIYIDPNKEQSDMYRAYERSAAGLFYDRAEMSFHMPIKKMEQLRASRLADSISSTNPFSDMITYRLAVTTTGEYSVFHGGTKESVMAALVTMVNRVNQVYEVDVAIKFELISDNDKLIFLDAGSDPYQNTDEDINVLTTTIDGLIDSNSYDIGHLVGTGGGGLAGFGVACTGSKAEGVTGNGQPINDPFYIDYVAHELGHQLGADHTYNGTSGACEGNRAELSAYEPGSGSTIMAYAGICDPQNLQQNSDAFFHARSIDQMVAFTRQGAGSTCGTRTNMANQAPTVNAGQDYIIPARTPFTLTGSASDPENDALTYSWEQLDLGAATSTAQEDGIDDGSRPLFRAFSPTSEPTRTLPNKASILSNSLSYGEAYATTTRDLNFRMLVRDGKGNLAFDDMKVSIVGNSESFSVTTPSQSSNWQSGEQAVVWNTVGTENSPVSCTNVDILLSLDGGNNFDRTLALSTPNDGQHMVTIAQAQSSQAKLKVKCSNNIFFALNSGVFSVNAQDAIKPQITGQVALTVNEDERLTLSKSSFTLAGGISADSIQISSGENFSIDGLVIIPDTNYNGVLKVPVIAKVGDMQSDPFLASVGVTSVNDAPTAVDDSYAFAFQPGSQVLAVLVNDSDIDGGMLTINAVNYQGSGTVSIVNNALSYTPGNQFSGTDNLEYTLSDGQGGSASASVTIQIAAQQTSSEEPDSGTDTVSSTSSDSGSSSSMPLWLTFIGFALAVLRRKGASHV